MRMLMPWLRSWRPATGIDIRMMGAKDIMAIERTLVVVKPDGVERNLIGEIISRYERRGLKVKALKLFRADEGLVKRHYPDDLARIIGEKSIRAGTKLDNPEEHGRKILQQLRKFISSGSVVAMVLEGENAVRGVRDITGYTDPASAEKGTVRGDLGKDSIEQANIEMRPVKNLVHASGTVEEAGKEIGLWFRKEEIF